VIAEGALRESDLLAFEIAIEQGDPGAIMCAYNATNGAQSCGNRFLLTTVLREDWDYQGFVMSDWGAVDAGRLRARRARPAVGLGDRPAAVLRRTAQGARAERPRITATGSARWRGGCCGDLRQRLDRQPAAIGTVEAAANSEVALEVAREGIVLLTNAGGILPLGPEIKRIAVIGGHADAGTLVGGGSSNVLGDQGPSVSVPSNRDGTAAFGAMLDQDLQPLRPAGRDPRCRARRDGALSRRPVRERGRARGEPGRRRDRVRHAVPDRRLRRARPVAARRAGRADRRGRRGQSEHDRGAADRRAGDDAVEGPVRRWSRPGTRARAAARRSPTCCSARSIPRAGCR
jgi:hypothetical protein